MAYSLGRRAQYGKYIAIDRVLIKKASFVIWLLSNVEPLFQVTQEVTRAKQMWN